MMLLDKFSQDRAVDLMEQFKMLAKNSDPLHSWTPDALASLLAGNSLIENESSNPASWDVIPFPLFFNLLGFPWNMGVGR